MTVPEKDRRYNGWTNYETWSVALWIDNEEGSYLWAQESAREAYKDAEATSYSTKRDEANRAMAETIKGWVEDGNPLADDATLYSQLLSGAISDVHWYELAQHYLTDEIVAEIDAEESEDEETETGIDWDAVRADLDSEEWGETREGIAHNPHQQERSILLQTGEMMSAEWWEAAEEEAESHGLWITAGDCDGTDIFIGESRDTPGSGVAE